MKIIIVLLLLVIVILIIFCWDRNTTNKKYQDDCRNLYKKPKD